MGAVEDVPKDEKKIFRGTKTHTKNSGRRQSRDSKSNPLQIFKN